MQHISSSNSFANSLDALVTRQAKLISTQEQLTTGKRVNRAGDDPAAAARAERALASEQRSVASQRAVDASNNAMTLTDTALADAGELLQQAREAIVSAGNPAYSDAERVTRANELASMREQLFAAANRTDGAGTYLFGGQGSAQLPFTDAPGGVTYQGTTGQTQSASGETLPLTTDGAATWMTARTGNGVFETGVVASTGTAWIDGGSVTNPSAVTGANYDIQFTVAAGVTTFSVLMNGLPTAQTNVAFTPPQAVQIDGLSATIKGQPANGDAFSMVPSTATLSVFDTIDQAIADLKTPSRTGSQIAQTNAQSLGNLDAVLSQMSAARAQVGAALTRVDAVTGRLSALQLSSKTERSSAEDIDMTQALSDFANQQTGYDAALKAYSMVQKLSLFNYINT